MLEIGMYLEGGKCIIGDEKAFTDKVIQERYGEVDGETNNILSCDFHEAVKNNFPNLVMVNYKEADKVQEVLAKRFCPDVLGSLPIHSDDSTNTKAYMKIEETGNVVPIEEWAESKRMFFDWALHWDDEQADYTSCMSETRTLEGWMSSCGSEAIRVSGK